MTYFDEVVATPEGEDHTGPAVGDETTEQPVPDTPATEEATPDSKEPESA